MHSSRMRTVRCSGCLIWGGEVSARGASAQGGVCLGGVCLGGRCLPGGVYLGGHTPPPLWTEFLTHACENITFPQLHLRTVITHKFLIWMDVVLQYK